MDKSTRRCARKDEEEERKARDVSSVFDELKIRIKAYVTAGTVNISRSHPLTRTNTRAAAAVPTAARDDKS